MNDVTSLHIREATVEDVPLIHHLICALAEYEQLLHEVVATEELLQRSLFGARRCAEVLIAQWEGAPVGFALFFHNYSTFLAKPGIHLEDLYVEPDFRGRGIGRALLGRVAEIAVERDCGRVEWVVLNWNTPAIAFYRSLGAKPVKEWTTFRLVGDALQAVAKG